MHCGQKILLSDPNPAVINAKVQLQNMAHEERLADKQYEQERYKIESKNKVDKRFLIIGICFFLVVGLFCAFMITKANVETARQEQMLQNTVDEIEIDIENGDFSSAYIKAETLYWDSSWSSEGKKKWNSTRKAVIKQIQEAEKNETGTITYKSNWLSDIFN